MDIDDEYPWDKMRAMQLTDWLSLGRGRGAALARRLGIPASMVARMATGEKRVPLDHCPYIQQFTGGLVTCEELRPDAVDYFALIREQGPPDSIPVEAAADDLDLVDRRVRQLPIDFPDRRCAAVGEGLREVA